VIYPYLAQAAADSRPSIVVTVVGLRGSAPCRLGSKLLVASERSIGTIGGGNLEMEALREANAMLRALTAGQQVLAKTRVVVLGSKSGDFAVQCCGGEVTLLFEPLGMRPQVAIFGAGHVGSALVQVLSTLGLAICLFDSRQSVVDQVRQRQWLGPAQVAVVHAPFPEAELAKLAPNALVYILTHDHSEDLALVSAALARSDLAFIGLIGSNAKWLHFQQQLKENGFAETDWKRVTTPIGIDGIGGKAPEIIAIAVAAQILRHLGW
jgi:xanthine dehydrogenase accessory factor